MRARHAPESVAAPSVAIIGSFRQHYDQVLDLIGLFDGVGIRVTSPKRSRILVPDEEFVRFELDDPDSSDVEIQYLALIEILSADAVFVLCPNGYVGRTTCYEIGRVHQSAIPVYYSERPQDLPIPVADSEIYTPMSFARYVSAHKVLPPRSASSDVPTLMDLVSRALAIGFDRARATLASGRSHESGNSTHARRRGRRAA